MTDHEILRTIDHEIAFMRMAAIELRHIAERTSEVATDLRRVADKLDAEADHLEKGFGSRPRNMDAGRT